MCEHEHESLTDYQYRQGQEACRMGAPCPFNESEEFQRGYAHQYELEEIETARSMK